MRETMRKRALDALAVAGFKDLQTHPALAKLINLAAANPGLEWCNYASSDRTASLRAYRAESRWISKQWREVVRQLKKAGWIWPEPGTRGVTDAQVIEAAKHAYCGRLEWNGKDWDYCTGQYYPTEYRQAVAAVLREAVGY
jgi:hypothetical protein